MTCKWYVADATGKILGRFASRLAYRLRGKHIVKYVPYADIGDYIIVINASKISITGRKRVNKIYHYHTGYPGGIKSFSFEEMLFRRPEKIIESAVKGMLPKGPLGRIMYRKLKVYAGNDHRHQGQQPCLLDI